MGGGGVGGWGRGGQGFAQGVERGWRLAETVGLPAAAGLPLNSGLTFPGLTRRGSGLFPGSAKLRKIEQRLGATGLQDYGTTGLRDYGSTGLRDHGRTRQRHDEKKGRRRDVEKKGAEYEERVRE